MFIVCGEALFDLFATGRTANGLGFDGRVGGSPFNVALGLARMGQPVGFCGGIGAGFAGERLMQALTDEGAVGFTVRDTVAMPPAPTAVVDTVGAGDTFQAGLLTWLAESGRLSPGAVSSLDADALQQALLFAARAAAITCARRGADLPRRHELA